MTPKEYLEQIFELEKEVDFHISKQPVGPKNKKLTRILELTQEINKLVDERADLRLKYGHREGYGV